MKAKTVEDLQKLEKVIMAFMKTEPEDFLSCLFDSEEASNLGQAFIMPLMMKVQNWIMSNTMSMMVKIKSVNS